MKAILITRVSTEEQKEAGFSLAAQIARLEKYCLNKGFEVIETFSFDESAYKNNRSEFDGILDCVITQKEKIAVCCDKVDRLSRNIFVTTLERLACQLKPWQIRECSKKNYQNLFFANARPDCDFKYCSNSFALH